MKDRKKLIGSILVTAVVLIIIIVGHGFNAPKKEISEKDVFTEESLAQNKEVKEVQVATVYINGGVKSPGVYKLKNGNIIDDLIKAAGGFTENADLDRLKVELNLAQKLRDGDHIYISCMSDASLASSGNSSVLQGQNGGKVNINKATTEELKTVPGIGDVTAKNIIDYREKHGAFTSTEELKNIDRIGDKTFEKLKDKLDVR